MIQKVLIVAGCIAAALILYFAPVHGVDADGHETWQRTSHWDDDRGVGDSNSNLPVSTGVLGMRLAVVTIATASLAYAFRSKPKAS